MLWPKASLEGGSLEDEGGRTRPERPPPARGGPGSRLARAALQEFRLVGVSLRGPGSRARADEGAGRGALGCVLEPVPRALYVARADDPEEDRQVHREGEDPPLGIL